MLKLRALLFITDMCLLVATWCAFWSRKAEDVSAWCDAQAAKE